LKHKPVRWPKSWLYPELNLFPTEEDRKKAGRAANWIILGSWSFWLGLPTILVGFPLLDHLVHRLNLLTGSVGALFRIALMSVCPCVCVIGIVWLKARQVRRFLRQRLQEVGVPICVQCSYDLTGNTSGICPECGTPCANATTGSRV
jgi:hypothetical protein